MRPCVLVVDDNEVNRVYLGDLCKDLGYSVVLSSSAAEALMLCQSTKQPFIAVLIDQLMPVMDGWELLRRLREMTNFVATPSVLISASPPSRPVDYPPNVDFQLVLRKPFDERVIMCFLCHELSGVWRTSENCLQIQKALIHPVRFTLPEQELQTFRELMEMGRLLRISEWARKLSKQNVYADIASEVIRYAESADLPALRHLLKQLSHSSVQSHAHNQVQQ
jgi:CheY-like chemotaxis protein